jgi:hypothetical protein
MGGQSQCQGPRAVPAPSPAYKPVPYALRAIPDPDSFLNAKQARRGAATFASVPLIVRLPQVIVGLLAARG